MIHFSNYDHNGANKVDLYGPISLLTISMANGTRYKMGIQWLLGMLAHGNNHNASIINITRSLVICMGFPVNIWYLVSLKYVYIPFLHHHKIHLELST